MDRMIGGWLYIFVTGSLHTKKVSCRLYSTEVLLFKKTGKNAFQATLIRT